MSAAPPPAGREPARLHDKNWWRKRNRALRDSIPPPMHRARSRAAVARLKKEPAWSVAESVLAYVPIGAELDVSSLLEAALTSGKRLILPRVAGDRLELYEVHDLTAQLAPQGAFEIPEPLPDSCRTIAADEAIDLAVLPGLAFDRRGGRIGYGCGYFDRLLRERESSREPATIGVCFESQVSAALPTTENDVRMDAVLTEERTYRLRASRGTTASAEETRALGRDLAGQVQGPIMILLQGNLGAGKTTCIQGLIAGLGVDGAVTSPSFVYEKEYRAGRTDIPGLPIHHFDLYRLPVPDSEEYAAAPPPDLSAALEMEAVTIVEWPDRLGISEPLDALRLQFEILPNEERAWTLETYTADLDAFHEGLHVEIT